MKKFMFLLSILLIGLTMISCEAPTVDSSEQPEIEGPSSNKTAVNIILLCGQSNADGFTHNYMLKDTNIDLYRKYSTNSKSKTKIMYKCNALAPNSLDVNQSDFLESVSLGMGFKTDRFGPEIGIAEVLDSKNFERETVILKYTHGGTTLWNDWLSSPRQGVLYKGFVDYIYTCLAFFEECGYTPYIKALCWMQGESDAAYIYGAVNYEKNEINFINDLRNEFAEYTESRDSKIKFISAGISNIDLWTYYEMVNAAKEKNAKFDPENNHYIDTIELGLSTNKEPIGNVDIAHYDSLSMVDLGIAFAEAILSFNVLK